MSKPVAFGYKMAWLAVRSLDPESVIAGLDIRNAVRTPWRESVDAIYASQSESVHPVLVTPALKGFVLVASPAFFDEASDAEPERIERFVTEAVARLGSEVQFFATHRVVEGHAWARADVDGLRRAFFYLGEAGETLLDRLPKSAVEIQLWDSATDFIPDESTVMSVAQAWSVDPTGIVEEFPEAGDCYLGNFQSRVESSNMAVDHGPRRPWWKFW